MADSTQVLREQSGIQYSGPQDKSEADPRDTLLTTIITGQFKRGRLDKPFMVTKANYRAKLGYDPKNLDYVAVEDALADGAPYVWVQRIQKGEDSSSSGGDGGGGGESYELAIEPDLQYSVSGVNAITDGNVILWKIEVDGTLYPQELGWVTRNQEDWVFLQDYINSTPKTGLYALLQEAPTDRLRILNITNNRKFVRLIPNVSSYDPHMVFTGNDTVKTDSNGVISFWLDGNPNITPTDPTNPTNPIVCIPNKIPVNNTPIGTDSLLIRYSVNGGEIKTHTEITSNTASIHKVLVNLLAYSPAFLHQNAITNLSGNAKKNFLVSYGLPICGAPSGSGTPMSFEFWATPNDPRDIVTKAFGGDFVLHSCGEIFWTEESLNALTY